MNIAMRTRIKHLREEKGISQSQMAEKLHMDEKNYKRIESGEKKTMDIDLLDRIAEALEADVTELLAETIHIENKDNTSYNGGSAAFAYEIHNNNTTETFELIREMKQIIEANRKTMEENSRIIALLLERK